MEIHIPLSQQTNFTGRNGYFTMTELDILEMSNDKTIMLIPVTTKKKWARCDIEVPVRDIPQLINGLLKVYERYANKSNNNSNV